MGRSRGGGNSGKKRTGDGGQLPVFAAVQPKGPAVAAERVRERWGETNREAAVVVDGDPGKRQTRGGGGMCCLLSGAVFAVPVCALGLCVFVCV